MRTSDKQDAQGWGSEKRKHLRMPCTSPVDYVIQDRVYRNLSRDISVGGLFVETWESFSVGQMIALTIPLIDNQESVKFEGKVVRTDPQGIGVKFI